MKIIKRRNEKYPLKVKLSDGKKLIIPKQSKFTNEFLKKHGCSLMAEYIALQFIGIKKIRVGKKSLGIYPINLLKWHKENTPGEIYAKVTVKGVSEGINKIGKGKGTAKYYKTVTAERIEKAIDAGNLVIMEQKDPIHTIVLLPDKEGCFMASHGKVTKVSIAKITKTATTNERYRGMIVVKDDKQR